MTLVSKAAFAACSSGVALATLCGLMWLVPRWTLVQIEELPARQAEISVVREAWAAGRLEGELLRAGMVDETNLGLRAARRFDDAVHTAARVAPDPDRERTVTHLTTSLRRVSQLEPGNLAVATLAAERDRQLEAWGRAAETGLVHDTLAQLEPLWRIADVGTLGGLLGLVVSLWASALLMRRVDVLDRPVAAAAPVGPPTAMVRPNASTTGSVPLLELDEPLHTLSIVDWHPLVDDMLVELEPLATHHGHEIQADVGDSLDIFVVDVAMLRRVLRELIEGPLRTLHAGTVTLRVRREGEGAVVSLVHRQRPGDPPSEGRRRGTVLVHSGVTALGGRLWWSAQPGDGVRAALWIPDRRVVDGLPVGSQFA